MNKNKDQDITKRLKHIWGKDNLTIKDLLLMKICIWAGEDAAMDIEKRFAPVFEDVETLFGRKLEEVSLGEYIRKQRKVGRPLSQRTTDILYKLLLFVPPHILKKRELEKAREEYMSKVETKDGRNPYYRRAMARANTAACMRLKRAYKEAYEEELIGGPLYDYLRAQVDELLEDLPQDAGDKDSEASGG